MKILRVFFIGIPAAAACFHNSHANNKTELSWCLPSVKAHQRHLELEQVQVLFRHGARTPIDNRKDSDDLFNNNTVTWDKERFTKVLSHVDIDYVVKTLDENETLEPVSSTNVLPGGCVCGNLTTIGQQEAYAFGNWLAREYITKRAFISPSYTSPSYDIYVRSTLKSRTVLTAVSVIAGLYGKENISQPVLIHSNPLRSDNMFPNFLNCSKVLQRFVHQWGVVSENQQAINKKLGVKDGERLYNFIEMMDVFHMRRHHGLPVPKYLVENEAEITGYALHLLLGVLGRGNVSELRTSIGSFVDLVCCRINEAITGTSENKMVLYSSHDTAIMCFLLVLGIFDERWPPFLSSVIMELYKDENGARYIRVLRNCEVVTMDTETGEELIPVEKFMELVEKYRVSDWNESCGNKVD